MNEARTDRRRRRRLELKETHPTLFAVVVLKAMFLVFIGLILIFGSRQLLFNYTANTTARDLVPLWTWGVCFIIIGLMFAYGAMKGNGHYKYVRRALVLASYLSAFWALGFWLMLIGGEIQGINAPLLWTLFAAHCVIFTREPAINPVTFAAKLEQRNEKEDAKS